MKKILATTAVATMAFTGSAMAQTANTSVLERVLASIAKVGGGISGSDAEVTGVFANTANNLLAGAVPNVSEIGGISTDAPRELAVGDRITVNVAGDETTGVLEADGTLTDSEGNTITDGSSDDVTIADGATVLTNGAGTFTVAQSEITNASTSDNTDGSDFSVAMITTTVGSDSFSTSGINASINNVLRGLTGPTAVTSGGASATEAVTALIGNMSTTALGAVNTGDIQLIGSNLSFAEDIDTATAGTSVAVQQQINNTVTQVGTITGQTVVALNSALNETNVNASVTNVMSGVNATIGRSGFDTAFSEAGLATLVGLDADAIAALTGGITTTGLGAVNTGTIISGATNEIDGVISSIVGTNSATAGVATN